MKKMSKLGKKNRANLQKKNRSEESDLGHAALEKERQQLSSRTSLFWGSHCGSVVTNPASIHEDTGSIPGPAQWVKDPALLWL